MAELPKVQWLNGRPGNAESPEGFAALRLIHAFIYRIQVLIYAKSPLGDKFEK